MLAVKVFSASTTRDRANLEVALSAWLAGTSLTIDSIDVRQSSDATHHCLSVVVFYHPQP